MTVPTYSPEREEPTGARNTAAIAAQSCTLADRIDALFSEGLWPLVLGGDCSVLIGAALGLRRRGRYGLVFIDGHLDFRHPGNSGQLGAAAGKDLAIVTGRGFRDLTDIDGLRPYFVDEDVVALGEREHDSETADIHDSPIEVIDLDGLRRAGVEAVAARASRQFAMRGLDGYWIHLDVDVLDDSVMPAVDSRQPGGLSPHELVSFLSDLVAHPLAAGMEVTIYDPELDERGDGPELIIEILESGLS